MAHRVRATPPRDVVVVGATALDVEALATLLHGLPTDLPAAVLVVVRSPRAAPPFLPRVLESACGLPLQEALDGETIEHGRVYLAPADRHLLVEEGRLRVVFGPEENGARPSIDVLFRTAARAYGRRVVGVVLSGDSDDGASGLVAIRQASGLSIVQDPQDALVPDMPRAAIEYEAVDLRLKVAAMPPALVRLTHGAVGQPSDRPEAPPSVRRVEAADGQSFGFTCPACHGPVWQRRDGRRLRFRCRVGHEFSAASMMAERAGAVEAALWAALAGLLEQSALLQVLERLARDQGMADRADALRDRARVAEQQAAIVRGALHTPNDSAAADM